MSRWEDCVVDRYSENRWMQYGPQRFHDETCTPPPMCRDNTADDDEPLSRHYRIASHVLVVAPTVMLFGMYGAIICAVFSLAQPWIGFMIGAIATSTAALWAFSN